MAGFKNGAWAKCWGTVESKSENISTARISISARIRNSEEYEQKFSGYVSFIGSSCASRALRIKDGDRIRLKDVEVQSKYVKEQNKTYYNFVIRAFETVSEYEASKGYGVSPSQSSGTSSYDDPVPSTVDDGELDVTSDKLPF